MPNIYKNDTKLGILSPSLTKEGSDEWSEESSEGEDGRADEHSKEHQSRAVEVLNGEHLTGAQEASLNKLW